MNIEKINISGNEYDIKDAKAQSMITDEFSDAQSYTAGDYCIYENALYKFTSDKEAGAWDSGKVTATNIDTELSGLNSSYEIIEYGVKIKNVIVVTQNINIQSDYAGWEVLPFIFPIPLSDIFAGLTGVHPASGKVAQFFVNQHGNLVCNQSITSGSYGSWSISGAYVAKS